MITSMSHVTDKIILPYHWGGPSSPSKYKTDIHYIIDTVGKSNVTSLINAVMEEHNTPKANSLLQHILDNRECVCFTYTC